MLKPRAAVRTGGALCRPVSAPHGCRNREGRERPARVSHLRPRARPAGSLTPHVSMSEVSWGARPNSRSIRTCTPVGFRTKLH